MESFYQDDKNVFLIHYSCESFCNIQNGKSIRITSIVVRNLKSAQTELFSIQKIAEQKSISMNNISDCYNDYELAMLKEYFDYIKHRNSAFWVHWNMLDMTFGFTVIEQRYIVLGGHPHIISD